MTPKTRNSSQASTALYHRVRSHNTKISKPEKHLHESLANALEAGIKQGKREGEVRVTVKATDLSRIMREFDQEREEKEQRKYELELATWEGRYADYLAVGLTKVKQTRVWRSATQLHGYSWVAFKSEILSIPLTDPIAIKYRNIVKAAAKEAGYRYQDVITAIEIYANRCSNQLHHAGIEQLTRNGLFDQLALRVDSDLKDLPKSTPRSIQSAIVPVQTMIKTVKDTWFATFVSNTNYTLTQKGQETLDEATNRVIT